MTAFVRATSEQQLRAALPILLAARRAVVVGGELDVINAIQTAGNAGLACHWARQVLQRVIPSVALLAWQTDLSVRQSDRTRALDRAIRVCRAVDRRRGGWTIVTPTREAA